MCEIDGEPLFRIGDAATAAVDALVSSGRLLVRDRRHNPGEPTRHPRVEHTRSESRGASPCGQRWLRLEIAGCPHQAFVVGMRTR